MALLAVRFGGNRRHEVSLLKQDLLLITPWHPFRMALEGAEMRKSRLGARAGGSAHRIRNIPQSGPPCFSPLIPGSFKGRCRLWEQVAEGGSKERAKNDPQLIVAVKLFSFFFPFLPAPMVGGQEAQC